ncbi:MAG: carboxymuconolactone decarboxylase family protein [Desulfobacterales bacterium]|nr:carboxymuconolactone decarboxylase family protein [Desulfobacterales bacterium]
MDNQTGTLEEITRHARNLRKHLPEMGKHYDALNTEIYRDGALTARHKRLMALSVAVTHGCIGCMLFQAEQSLELGASREEVIEALAVAVGLGGSMASSKSAQVMAFLEQKGLV